MDFLQNYAALRMREDRRLDAMLYFLTECQLCGWEEEPHFQTLYIVAWRARGAADAVAKCDNGHIEFTHANLEGEVVYREVVDSGDRDGIEREAAAIVEHLTAVRAGGT